MEQYEALLYFISGIASYKFLSYAFNTSKALQAYNTTIKNCLGALRVADETKKIAQEMKYILLKESGMPILELRSVKDQDRELTRLWRQIAMNALFSVLPKHIIRNLRFKDWESAMKIINKETR